MKCYRKNGSDGVRPEGEGHRMRPSMKCYRKNGSDVSEEVFSLVPQGPQ